MIFLEISLYPNGCINCLKARGHSNSGKKGYDIICAAVTALTRTTARLLSEDKSIVVNGNAPEPGMLDITIQALPAARTEWIKGITDFLLKGLFDLKEEYPDRLNIKLWRRKYGT